MQHHLAILAPYGKIHADDLVYMKESGGPVKGQFTVAEVETFDNLTDDIVDQIYDTPPLKWYFSRYATLIHVTDVIVYGNPFHYKQKGRSAWLLLDEPLMQTLTAD